MPLYLGIYQKTASELRSGTFRESSCKMPSLRGSEKRAVHAIQKIWCSLDNLRLVRKHANPSTVGCMIRTCNQNELTYGLTRTFSNKRKMVVTQ